MSDVRAGGLQIDWVSERVERVRLLKERQQRDENLAGAWGASTWVSTRLRGVKGGRKGVVVRAGVVVAGQGDLLEVVGALHTSGGFADFLDGGQQEADEDGDDGDDHEQFDQRKAA